MVSQRYGLLLGNMQSTIDAVSNPYRREIIRLVWDKELSSGEIARHFDVTWQSISRNLKVLRTAGLIDESRRGTQRLYKANREALRPVEDLLHRMWEDSLDNIVVLAEREHRSKRRR